VHRRELSLLAERSIAGSDDNSHGLTSLKRLSYVVGRRIPNTAIAALPQMAIEVTSFLANRLANELGCRCGFSGIVLGMSGGGGETTRGGSASTI
jgi:hypothetical protein